MGENGAVVMMLLLCLYCEISQSQVPVVEFSSSEYTVSESMGTVTLCVTLSNAMGEDITVTLSAKDGSKAVSASDYELNEVTILFDAASMEGAEECVAITVIDDDSVEGDHNFTVCIVEVTGPTSIGDINTATVLITDNDVASISMVSPAQSVVEDNTIVEVCAVLSSPIGGTEIDIMIELGSNGSSKAVEGMDFSVNTPTVTFSAGTGVGEQSCADITINEDRSFEGNHSFTVSLSRVISPSMGIVTFVDPTEAVITIVDDDEVVLQLSTMFNKVTEGENAQVCLGIISSPMEGRECNIDVTLETVDGTATSEDYFPGAFVFSFPTNATHFCIRPVRTLLDSNTECEEYFTVVEVSAGPGNIMVTPNAINITIVDIDDSAPMLSFTNDTRVTVAENVGSIRLCAEITFTGTLECNFEAPLTIQGDDAIIINEDFISTNSIVFQRGLPSGSEACTDITILDDEALEGKHSFTVSLIGSESSIHVEIMDNEVVFVQLLEPSAAREGDDLTVCATLTFLGPTIALEHTITLYLNTTNGKAELGLDFDHPTIFSITFDTDSGSGSVACVSISTTDDNELEEDEDFSISLISSNLEGNVELSSQSVIAIINENDIFCPAETLTAASGTYSWPPTPAGNDPVLLPCEFGPEGQTVTLTASNINQSLVCLVDVVKITDPSEETEQNVAVLSDVLNQIAVLVADSRVILEPMTVNQIVQILGTIQEWNRRVLEGEGSNIVQSFEFIINSFTQQENFTDLTVILPNIALVAERLDAQLTMRNGRRFSASVNNDELSHSTDDGSTGNDEFSREDLATIELPPSLFNDNFMLNESVELVFAIYKAAALFPLNNVSDTTVVGSSVLGATVVTDVPLVVNEAVEILLRIVQKGNVTNHTCVFWDFGAAGGQGNWSSEGCRTERDVDNADVVRCLCNHLTNFAVLVDICSRTGCDPLPSGLALALDIISIIGVSLSLAGIVATVITLLVFKKLCKRDATKFHVQLCAALFAMLLVFVIGIDRTEVYGGCVAVSALIHYFTLAATMWMGAESILLFKKLIIVHTRITTRYIIGVSIICWTLPIVPVVIPLAIDRDFMVTYQMLETVEPVLDYCFISNTIVFFGAFLGPIFAIILFNCVVFVMIVSVLIRHQCCSKMRHNEKMATKTAIIFLMRVFGVMSLFGLTWLFGAFTVTGATLVFQVLFAVFNSLQGFFIFLFFCIINQDARELWKEKLSCGRYKSESTPTSKSGGAGITPRHNQGTLSIDSTLRHTNRNSDIESTDTIRLSYLGESSTLKFLSAATNQETILETNKVFTNPVISPVAEKDSELRSTDPVTPESTGDSVQYSQEDTHEGYEYESCKIDFS